jgi:hypothetical protein
MRISGSGYSHDGHRMRWREPLALVVGLFGVPFVIPVLSLLTIQQGMAVSLTGGREVVAIFVLLAGSLVVHFINEDPSVQASRRQRRQLRSACG